MPDEARSASMLELLRRVVDECLPIYLGPGYEEVSIKAELLAEIEAALKLPGDALFSAVAAITSIEPEINEYSGGRRWLKCVYCASRSIRLPLQHRAGCAWATLKEVWDAFPGA